MVIKNKKSQSSMEYMILMGFLIFVILTVLGVALYYALTAEDTVRGGQIYNFGNKIVSSAESVYYSGEPAKATINPYMPDGVSVIDDLEDPIGSGQYYLKIVIERPSGQNVLLFKSEVPIVVNTVGGISRPLYPTGSGGIVNVILEANSTATNITIK